MKKYLLITLVLILLQACVNETLSSRRGIYVTKSNQHALVIGIDKYQHFTNLNGAVNDANLLAQTLRNKNINLPNNRVLLNEQATRKTFMKAWKDMLQAANPG
ncbi:caspase family protein [Candidatus Marithrix sp. Canyon 246]|uniref:caspase family protein n=1 Tax=Candidatus Marithrix sp. Canyon 246 TaxID=1827136 RepID=UPI00084A1E64|nr:caspase family protein [Candidatus Marithrix sp. Canyon 246]